MLKMNFRKIESFNAINKIPMFYQQIFLSYNMCETIKPINQMNNFEIFSQSIWGNELFKTKENCLFFKNWIDSGFLLVKDLFDNDGTFISTEKVLNKLKNKSNWITEFFVLKNVNHKKVTKIGDPSICQFIQNSCYKDVSFISTHGIDELMDGILGQSSSPHKKIQYLKITVILKYPLKCINSIKHLDEGTQFYCINTSYPMDNSLSGRRSRSLVLCTPQMVPRTSFLSRQHDVISSFSFGACTVQTCFQHLQSFYGKVCIMTDFQPYLQIF